MKAKDAAVKAVRAVQAIMADASGDEAEVLEAFSDEVGSMLDGWQMRLEELEEGDNEGHSDGCDTGDRG